MSWTQKHDIEFREMLAVVEPQIVSDLQKSRDWLLKENEQLWMICESERRAKQIYLCVAIGLAVAVWLMAIN